MAASSSSSSSTPRNWTREEDAILIYCVNIFEAKNWKELAGKSGLQRNGSSCRFRWTNYLNPEINNGGYTEAEEDKILHLRTQGYKWSQIAKELPERTDNHIKNHYNGHLTKETLEEFQDIRDYTEENDYQEFQSFVNEILYAKNNDDNNNNPLN